MSASNAHRLSPSPDRSRRVTFWALVAVTVVSIACAFGPQWSQYLGLGLAVAAMFASTWSSWREIDRMAAQHTAEMKSLRQQMRDAAHAHHVEAMEMIARFEARTEAHRAQLADLTAQLVAARDEVAVLEGRLDESSTRLDNSRRRVADLEYQVALLEVQLEDAVESASRQSETEADGPDADVVHMPRRIATRAVEFVDRLRQA